MPNRNTGYLLPDLWWKLNPHIRSHLLRSTSTHQMPPPETNSAEVLCKPPRSPRNPLFHHQFSLPFPISVRRPDFQSTSNTDLFILFLHSSDSAPNLHVILSMSPPRPESWRNQRCQKPLPKAHNGSRQRLYSWRHPIRELTPHFIAKTTTNVPLE